MKPLARRMGGDVGMKALRVSDNATGNGSAVSTETQRNKMESE
jgi:hypothetical protein